MLTRVFRLLRYQPEVMLVTLTDLSKMIDHSLLHPTMTDEEIRQGCELARRYNVATACVKRR
jgi:deoxyribose-phosphate aldolase